MLLLIYLLSPHLFLSCAFFPSNITFQSSFHTLSVKQGIVYQPVSAHLKECGEEEERDRKKTTCAQILFTSSSYREEATCPSFLTAACLDNTPLHGGGGGGQ